MNPLNCSKVFVGVRLRRHEDEAWIVGCRDDESTTEDVLSVFLPFEVLPIRVPTADVAEMTTFALPVAPEHTYQVTYNKTGGISSAGTENDAYHRRHIVAAEPSKERQTLIVINPAEASLRDFLRRFPDVEQVGEPHEDDEGNVFVRVSTPGDLVATTIFAAAKNDLACVSMARRQPTIYCNTLIRPKHTYGQQTRVRGMHEIGPTRDLWRFNTEYVPPAWLVDSIAPMTWEAHARHVFRTLPWHRLEELTQPLHNFAWREGLKAVDETLASAPHASLRLATAADGDRRRCHGLHDDVLVMRATLEAMQACPLADVGRWAWECALLSRELAGAEAGCSDLVASHAAAVRKCDDFAWRVREAALARPHIAARQPTEAPKLRCPALTEPQQEQLIHLFHCIKFGMDFLRDDEVAAARAAQFQFVLRNGSTAQFVTVYEKTGQFRGFGENLRVAPENEDDLPAAVRNRCRIRDGVIMGAGGQGCKGIVYPPKPGVQLYQPLRQHVRKLEDNQSMVRKRLRTTTTSET